MCCSISIYPRAYYTILHYRQIHLGGQRKVPFTVHLELGDVLSMCVRDWPSLVIDPSSHPPTQPLSPSLSPESLTCIRTVAPELATRLPTLESEHHRHHSSTTTNTTVSSLLFSSSSSTSSKTTQMSIEEVERRRIRSHAESLYSDALTAVILPQDKETLLVDGPKGICP